MMKKMWVVHGAMVIPQVAWTTRACYTWPRWPCWIPTSSSAWRSGCSRYLGADGFFGWWFFGTLFGGIETRTPGKKTNRNHGFWSLLLMVFDGFWWFLPKKSLIRCLGPKSQPQIRSQKVFKSVGYGFSIGPPIAIMRGERGPWWY